LEQSALAQVALNLVVERAKACRDATLLPKVWKGDFHRALIPQTDVVRHVGLALQRIDLVQALTTLHPVVEETRIYKVPV
jgi:hypothetical protein